MSGIAVCFVQDAKSGREGTSVTESMSPGRGPGKQAPPWQEGLRQRQAFS